MDGGAWKAAVHGVAKSWIWLSDFTFTFHFHVLEKEMATHSSVLAWRIPGTGEPGGLPSMGLHSVGHDWSDLAAAAAAVVAVVVFMSQGSSVAFCFSGRLSRISKCVWLRGHRIHSNLLPLCWDSEHTRFLNVPFKNGISDSCKPSALPYTQALLAFKAKYSGGLSSQCRIPNVKAWCMGQTPHSLERTSAIVIVLPFMGHL